MDRTIPAPHSHYSSFSQRLAEPQSLARTPSRRERFTEDEINPLLSDLSPTATLEALVATDAVPHGNRNRGQSFIQQSVASASTSERAWGIKAALASKKLQDWHHELAHWPWHGYNFGIHPVEAIQQSENVGGPPEQLIKNYVDRIETIKDDMETLEVEELKDYVRSSHGSSQSVYRSTAHGNGSYDYLDDFTTLITATIIQALPTLSRLNALLFTWSIRLLILKQVPAFQRDLAGGNESLLSAWIALEKPNAVMTKGISNFSRKAFTEIQAVLQDQISQLGQRLDAMLDLLEGSEDALPEQWIDDMDGLESEYSRWMVKAEELVLNNELHDDNANGSNKSQGTLSVSDRSVLPVSRQSTAFACTADGQDDGAQQEASEGVNRGSHYKVDNPQKDYPRHVHEVYADVATMPVLSSKGPDGELDAGQSKMFSPSPGHKPPPLALQSHSKSTSVSSSVADSEISYSGSATSDYLSDRSSPEILDACVVDYLGARGLKSPGWGSAESQPSQDLNSRRWSHVEKSEWKPQVGLPSGLASPTSQRSRASTVVPDNGGGQSHEPFEGDRVDLYRPGAHVRARSTSMKSFEFAPISEIRQVLVRRSDSYSSASSGLRHSETANPANGLYSPLSSVTASSSKDDMSLPSTVVANQLPPVTGYDPTESHDNLTDEGVVSLPPLIPPKARHRFEQVSDLSPNSSSVKINQKAETGSSKAIVPSTTTTFENNDTSGSIDDQLEARISSILVNIPVNIRLTSAPGLDAPDVVAAKAPSTPKSLASRLPSFRMSRSQTVPPPAMTLAPAQPKTPKQKSQNGEPEIKLYHLHQPGKDAPIKLFVRLVGESGERVMVRIGGGWADLGEYLREYANHHGRRTASDSRFDIQGLPSSPLSSQVSSSSRPTTPASIKDSIAHTLKRGNQSTPAPAGTAPKTPTSDNSLRPSSRGNNDEDSPSLGLAGPGKKRVDMSPRKQQWVDEIIDQARQGGK